ncbi:MAG TPA: iron chelate uptake ABC transporter family permease subunit [Bacillota bacterium]|jgi:iron complex transport system permease protein
MKTRAKQATVLGLLAAGLVASALLGTALGTVPIPLGETVRAILSHLPLVGPRLQGSVKETTAMIILVVRLPRVTLAALVGLALGVSGTAFQGLFRNPMADPYLIGVSSGAAAGAALGIALHLETTVATIGAVPLLAFAGATAAVFAVYRLARRGSRVPVTDLLLSGVAVGALLSALVSAVTVFSQRDLRQIVFWLMGGFSGRGWEHVIAAAPYILVGVGILAYHARDLNALLLGEEAAEHLGISVERLKRWLLVATTMATGAAVAASGVIGFVGLVIPHAIRLIVGPDHRLLLPASGLAGAILLILADLVARTLIPPSEIPVGIITALLGGPFFIYLLRRSRRGAGG